MDGMRVRTCHLPHSKITVLVGQEQWNGRGMPGSDLLIGDIFTNAARAVPDRTAAALGDRSLTFAAVEERAGRLVRVLADLGIGRGARVAVWSRTTLDAIPLFAALAKVGAVFIPVNGLLGPDEAADIMATCRPGLVVTDTVRAPVAGAMATATLEELDARADGVAGGAVAGAGLSERDPHVAFFTSGSTGRPKGAVLSHRANYLRSHPGALLEPRGAMVCPYPLFHMGAWTIALQQWQARDAVVLVESADAGSICAAVARHRATRLNCIPAVWHRILDHVAASGPGALATLRFADTGTSATPPELLDAIADLLPAAHLRVFYGSTEAGSVACLEQPDFPEHPGSCGPPAPGVEVRQSDDGELWVRSALLFDGYLDDPGATAAALVDGWYRTGDLVERDADGFLSVIGRTGDLVRTGGESVVPAEVEGVLAGHHAVHEVAVIGLPDPHWGDVVCAVVVVEPGRTPPSLDDLRSRCDGQLAPFKHPRRLHLVDALPRTATGQVQRRLLVERLSSS